MGRILSARRFTLVYALVSSLLVVLATDALHRYYCRLELDETSQNLVALERLLVAAYREMPEERFSAWLAGAQLREWAPPGWNLCWYAGDASLRWIMRPGEENDFPPEILAAIRAFDSAPQAPARQFQMRWNRRQYAVRLHRLSPEFPRAGLILLRAPMPAMSIDVRHLAVAAVLLLILLAGILTLYHRLMLRGLQSALHASGLPPLPSPATGETFESWAKQYAASASRKIAETRDLFDSLFDGLQDGTLILDADNRILKANATATHLLDEHADTLAGRRLAELADHDLLEPLVEEIRAKRAYQTAEIQLANSATLCNFSGIPLHEDEQAAEARVMLVVRDLTRIRQLERAGEEYAVNVSHELKTPLTLILGYTETLLSHADMAPEFRERSLRTIERHAKRIIRIIDDLLRLAWLRNEADTVGIPRTPVLLGLVVSDVVAACREWARSAGLEIETHVPEELVWSLNSGLMEEALVNLVKNAILYALVGPVEIRVRVLDNGCLEIAVIDRGPGLKPEDATRIFDRFYRVDKSRARSSGGSGLGLPIVQQIVEAHHGTAHVETSPGEGCTFILEIPPN